MLLVYTPCSSKEEAKFIASSLLKEGLIACANIIPNINSLYVWEGIVKDEEEFLLFAKCKEENKQGVEDRITELHSYECPCILQFSPTKTNTPFEAWLNNQ
ncbi:Periplasmic divalent cation tolerance protein [Lentisphaera araneosa HTCC2155]|jgi:periplasmic divalent cation tolerance protein|uniref:Periplasmic divalent cation tolerance protein n=1 Tax=Lentisphaera araneosa HTCC2155 TaxID=313628 RepID=A6DH84_9BACT|nr:divalent-cation tolerance protein CutA [Lentisphaera araneosa]EDM28967.1 Periplasmic divalent cation tolerance protein [Lentisphaera araneosa HTCC2155]